MALFLKKLKGYGQLKVRFSSNVLSIWFFITLAAGSIFVGLANKGAPAYLRVHSAHPEPTIFQLFWAPSGQPYSEKNSVSIPLGKGEQGFRLPLPPLHTLRSIRIDPANSLGEHTLYTLTLFQDDKVIRRYEGKMIAEENEVGNLKSRSVSTDGGWRFSPLSSDPYLIVSLDNPGNNLFLLKRLLQAIIFASAITYFGSRFLSSSSLARSSKKHTILVFGGFLIGAVFLLVVTPLPLLGEHPVIYFISLTFMLSSSLFCLFMPAAMRASPNFNEIFPKRFEPLWYALPSFIVWSFYLIAFWPASLSLDSLEQWRQVQAGLFQLNDWHPAFHTMLMWGVTRIWNSPSMVAIWQMVILGMAAGWAISVFRHYGLPHKIAWIVSIIFAVLPVNGFLVITLWKDIPYGVSLLVLTVFIFHLVKTNGAWVIDTRNWIGLGLAIFSVAIFRHNGLLPAFGTMFFLLLCFGDVRPKIFAALLLSVCLLVLIRGPVYELFDVKRGNPMMVVMDKVSAAISKRIDPKPSGEERIREADNKEKIEAKGQGTAGRLGEYLASSSTLWRVLPLDNFFRREARANIWRVEKNGVYGIKYINSNKIGVDEASLAPQLRDKFYELYTKTRRGFFFFIWRPACYLYFFIFCLLVASYRLRNGKILCMALPLLFSSLPVMVIIIHKSIFRYHYGLVITSLLCGIALLWQPRVEVMEEENIH